jgi:hypothetical protein
LDADFIKGNANSEVRSRVDHFFLGLKVTAARVNSYKNGCLFREGVCHINVTSVETELTHAGNDTDAARGINHFGGGHERESGGATALLSHVFHPRGSI